jgi:glycosyltransferase involved in cell wall biosynthesis
MRILLTSTASYVPPRGGSTRSNLVWLEHLVSRGHECRVICGAAEDHTEEHRSARREELQGQGLEGALRDEGGVEVAEYRGIGVFASASASRRASLLRAHIDQFEPDWVLVSSEDISHTLLKQASTLAPGRIVYMAHTPQFFPFGSESWNPDEAATAAVQASACVVTISQAVSAYVQSAMSVRVQVVHPPIYRKPPYRNVAHFGAGRVTMVNPCAVKGISIFLELAATMPDVSFAALPGWGTTSQDRAKLEAMPNVKLLAPVRRMETIFEQSSVFLVPSLWMEGFGLIAMEAMLSGIPVMSSDSGGLKEAKSGTGYVIPVQPIASYKNEYDDRHMPVPNIDSQSIEPWVEALRHLLANEREYNAESARSFERATRFVSKLDAGELEQVLLSLPAPDPKSSAASAAAERVARLSPEKRAMLLSKLRKLD